MKQNTCQRCGAKWTARIAKPIRCPRCGSPKWKEAKKEEGRETR